MSLKSDAIKFTRKWIEKEYGKRCKSYSPGCPSCDQWKLFDALFIDWETEWNWPTLKHRIKFNKVHKR